MPLMFSHIKLGPSTFFRSNVVLKVCSITQIFPYHQWSEQICNQAFNDLDVSLVNGVICQQIMPHAGDKPMTLDVHFPIYSLLWLYEHI